MKKIAKILLAVALVVCCLLGMMLCTQAATEKGIVSSPKAGTAYKLGFNNGTSTYYFAGAMNGYYGTTTTDASQAVDVYLESVTGGYNLYFKDGSTKTYIYIYEYIPEGKTYPKGSFGITTDTPSTPFTYDSDVKTLIATYGENSYYMGTYGNYTTFSASSTYYITGDNAANVDVSQYPARLYTTDGSGSETTTPTTTQAAASVETSVVSSPKAGTAYKLGFNNGTSTYYFAGAMNGYYGTTTTNAANAVDVYLESVTGGYNLYFKDGSTKTYIYIYEYIPEGKTYPKGSFGITTDTPSTPFTYDSDVKTLIATYGENSYYMGTYGSYTTFSASSTYYITGDNAANVDVSQYPARLYAEKSSGVTITTQPSSKIVEAGETAKFTVKASGTGLKYQWQCRTSSSASWKNSSASTAKKATLTMPGTVARNKYQYRCKITDANGNVKYTNTCTLYVLGIKTQPSSKAVVAGKTAKFTVAATGHKVTYQWQYKSAGSSTWKNSGATSAKTATLSVSSRISLHGNSFRCKITDSKGNVVYTNTVKLYVLGIKTQPVSKSVKVGATVKFAVEAVGNGLTYQWQVKAANGKVWYDSGASTANSATLKLTAKSSYDGNQYRCKITDKYGKVVYTDVVTLTLK